MLTQDQISRYQTQGFVKGNRILSDDQVAGLCAEMERVIRDKDKGGRQPMRVFNLTRDANAAVWQILNIWEASDAFRDVETSETLAEDVARLTGAGELRVWHDQIQYKPAGTGGVTAWHQDNPYWPILRSTSQHTAWVALDDVDEDNGCMSMVPGSHRWGDQIEFLQGITSFDAVPKRFKDHDIEVKLCPVRKGEVHFHHALTWHGSHGNRSGRPRRALAIHFMTEETRYNAKGEHPVKKYVTVADGEKIEGDHFPLVWSRARTAALAAA